MRWTSWATAGGFASRFAGAQAVNLLVVYAAFATAGPVAAGVVLAARSVPSLVAPWLAGWWFDRHSPRALTAAVGVVEVSTVVLCLAMGAPTPLLLTVVALVLGATGAVFDTTVGASLTVSGARPLAASVLTGLAVDGGKLAAALVAFLASTGSAWGWVALVLSVPGVAVLVLLAPRDAILRGSRDQVWGRWVRPLVPVLPVLVLLNLTVGSMMFWQGLLAQQSPAAFAIVNAGLAVGAVAGNLVLGRAGLGRGSVSVGVFASAAGLFGMSWCSPVQLPWLFGSALVWGLGCAWWFQGLRGWLVTTAPVGFQGRAGSVLVVVARAALVLSGPLLGAVVLLFGAQGAAQFAAAVAVVSAAFLPRALPWSRSTA